MRASRIRATIPRMSGALLQVHDERGQRAVRIDRPILVIGRRATADLPLSSADVSRDHAEIVRTGDEYRLRDRGSRHGTFVNGEQIADCVLAHGDTIRFGRSGANQATFLLDLGASPLRSQSSEVGDLRQLSAVLDGLRALSSGRVLDEVLTLVLDSAIESVKADRGFIMLAEPEGALEFKIARARGGVTIPGTTFATSEKIPREVFSTGRSRIVQDLLDADLADRHGGTIAAGIRHVQCVPLRVAAMGESGHAGAAAQIGVLYLDGRERGRMTSPTTAASLEAFAVQAAMAIESARLYAASAEKARTDRDLRVAADMQRALLPEPRYACRWHDLAAVSAPCRTVGGDFFDYLELGDGRFGFALGDVAGKGPAAALLAAVVQSHFAALAPVSPTPADTLARLNGALLRRAVEARFATMCYGVLERDGMLHYCNAGQEAPLVISRNGLHWLDVGGPVLGLLPAARYESGQVRLAVGDVVLFFSDGVTEARSPSDDEFGRDRLIDAVQDCHGVAPDAVLDRLLDAVNRFAAGAPQADDLTVLVLRRLGASPG